MIDKTVAGIARIDMRRLVIPISVDPNPKLTAIDIGLVGSTHNPNGKHQVTKPRLASESTIDTLINQVLTFHGQLLSELQPNGSTNGSFPREQYEQLRRYRTDLGNAADHIAYSLVLLDTFWNLNLKRNGTLFFVYEKTRNNHTQIDITDYDKTKVALALFYSFLSPESRKAMMLSNEGKEVLGNFKASKLYSAMALTQLMDYWNSHQSNGFTGILKYVANGYKPNNDKDLFFAQLAYEIGLQTLRKMKGDTLTFPVIQTTSPMSLYMAVNNASHQMPPYQPMSSRLVAN